MTWRQPITVPLEVLPHGRDLDLPAYETEGAAGLDLRAAVESPLELEVGARALVPTGLRIAVPTGYEAQVRARSGWVLARGVIIPNAPGTIDSDYRGEVKVILANISDELVVIERGMRIAQLIFAPIVRAAWRVENGLDETRRGGGGFGHTGAS